jgi:sugar/nucleoside kinase (ribokinase family)
MTGAGDAFGAGFLSAFIRTKGDIKAAMQLAAANSAACIQQWGSKEGILTKGEKFSPAVINEI